MNEEKFAVGYLDERKLARRWPGPLAPLVNLVFISAIFYATWWIFQDPRGWMRMYTPYVGYMYSRWLLVTIIWVAYVFSYWPFRRAWLARTHPLIKGIVLTAVTWVVLMVLIKGFFEGLLGNLAIAYFSPARLQKLGITAFFSEEYSSQAIVMFAAIASWLSPAWVVAFEEAPWRELRQPVRGCTIWMASFSLSILIYLVTMHPHMGILYYPWQYFSSLTPPWWEHFADTVSGNFSIGWIMCCTVVVWLYETIWERYPFSLIRNDKRRRFAAFFGIFLIALALAAFLYFGQEIIWGAAIRGTKRDAAPDWRWLHVGEMAVFLLLPALWLKFYHGNWPTRFSTAVNVVLRTVVSVVGAVAIYFVYYKTAHLFLGVQKGFSHPQQFPMIPTIWFINIMLINYWYMDGWPGWKLVGVHESETAANMERARSEVAWSPSFGIGLASGLALGVIVYFATIAALPTLGNWLTIYANK